MNFNMMNLTKYAEMIPIPQIKNRMMDVAITLAIPFNRWLGMRIETLSPYLVTVVSPPRTLRQNHVGGAHACALALLGEYPAGLLISQTFSLQEYRLIISNLNVEYAKQGRGFLTAEVVAPKEWPQDQDGEIWIELKTEIKNSKGELVATAQTKWQLKKWELIKKKST